MEKLISWTWNFIVSCWKNDILRYIFIGGCTTLVNLVSYYLLRTFTAMDMNLANTISIILAILFAYVTNATLVFQSDAKGVQARFAEFVKFISARAATMVLEIGGVWFLAEIVKWNDYAAKFLIQFVVLAANYVFSKFFVFVKEKP